MVLHIDQCLVQGLCGAEHCRILLMLFLKILFMCTRGFGAGPRMSGSSIVLLLNDLEKDQKAIQKRMVVHSGIWELGGGTRFIWVLRGYS